MTIFYNCTGTRRKELVTAISEITGAKAEYQFMPTQAYQIDYFTVDKDGNLSFDDRADSEEIELLIEALYQRGFVAESPNLLTIELPEEMFLNYILDHRVNEEEVLPCRSFFWNELKDRIEGKNAKDAAIEVNYWCAEEAT